MKAIEAVKLSYAYPHQEMSIQDLDISFASGQFAAITGSNGAGKTTLGKLLAGIYKPAAGRVTIFGRDSKNMKLSEIGSRICYCFQNPDHQLFTLTVGEEIGFALKYRGLDPGQIKSKVQEMMDFFQITHLEKSLPMLLSTGEKKRVVLAAGLVLDPTFVILDEPTVGLDQERIGSLAAVIRELKARGSGGILISHDQRFVAENADRRILMVKGRLEADEIIGN